MAGKSRVVIVGAGPAGTHLARGLAGAAEVTLVSRQAFFEIWWSNVRLHTEPAFAARVLVPLADVPGLPRHVHGVVASVSEGQVTLQDGTSLPYDFLVLAAGSSYSDAASKDQASTLEERLAAVKADHERLAGAQSVLIVGGGPVGVEIAAEILTDMPGKRVRLVTGTSRLLASEPPALGAAAHRFLTARGAQVDLNTRVKKGPGGALQTEGGEPLEGDLTYHCTGITPNTGFLAGGPLAGALDERGFVKVDSHFQVEGSSNVYALGDCCSLPGQKLGYLATMQAHLLAANLRQRLAKGAAAAPKPWRENGGLRAQFVSLGRGAGTGHVGWITFPSFAVRWIKSRDLFAGKTRRELGLAA